MTYLIQALIYFSLVSVVCSGILSVNGGGLCLKCSEQVEIWSKLNWFGNS